MTHMIESNNLGRVFSTNIMRCKRVLRTQGPEITSVLWAWGPYISNDLGTHVLHTVSVSYWAKV